MFEKDVFSLSEDDGGRCAPPWGQIGLTNLRGLEHLFFCTFTIPTFVPPHNSKVLERGTITDLHNLKQILS